MLVFAEKGKLEYLEKTSLCRVENQQTNPRITPSLGIEPSSHWWKSSALTAAPSLHPRGGVGQWEICIQGWGSLELTKIKSSGIRQSKIYQASLVGLSGLKGTQFMSRFRGC